jgi:hypothetical protein
MYLLLGGVDELKMEEKYSNLRKVYAGMTILSIA